MVDIKTKNITENISQCWELSVLGQKNCGFISYIIQQKEKDKLHYQKMLFYGWQFNTFSLHWHPNDPKNFGQIGICMTMSLILFPA